jgi:DNA-binding transcriptional MerR regulator
MELLGIGEFARRSRLSPKALRLYNEMGLLLPARVDAASGYRFYGVDQLEQARLVATLRQLKVPLAEIKAILLGPGGQVSAPQWQLISESLHTWGGERDVQPSELGVRITYLATPPRTSDSVPDCDFAVPFALT